VETIETPVGQPDARVVVTGQHSAVAHRQHRIADGVPVCEEVNWVVMKAEIGRLIVSRVACGSRFVLAVVVTFERTMGGNVVFFCQCGSKLALMLVVPRSRLVLPAIK